jgi:alkanesulfonate monooxygenase SsuD/methylene tetrahydromethanopterin reductase-like flavin-dependent oxidoreductase (luciferase family)
VETYGAWLGEGFARPGARRTAETFEIATNCNVVVTDDVDAALDAMKPGLGFYVGGMGARDMNFHKDLFARMGYEKEADEIQRLFFEGKRDEAIATVPSQAVDDISLVGPAAKIRDALPQWEEAGVTMLVIGASSLDQLRTVAEVILTA